MAKTVQGSGVKFSQQDTAPVSTLIDPSTFEAATVTSGALNVNTNVTPGSLQDVNLTQVDGVGISLGQKTSSASLPVVLSSDDIVDISVKQYNGNTVASAGQNGVFAVGGNQSAGAAISTNAYPQLIGGSDYAGSPALQLARIDSTGHLKTDLGKVLGQTVVTGNGVTGVGSQRVTIASDNTPFQTKSLASFSEVSFTTTTAQAVATTDVLTGGYQSVTIQYTSQGTNAVCTAQVSNDNSTWGTLPVQLSSAIQSNPSSTATTTGVFHTSLLGYRYFRINVTGISAGTTAGVVEFSTFPISLMSVSTNSIVVGSVANGGTDSGNPVKVGFLAKTANPTAVTDGQRVNALSDKLGKQVTVNSIRDLKARQVTTITSSTAETTIVTAVASTFLDVYGLIIENTSATACECILRDSTAGTVVASFLVPAGETRGFWGTESAALTQTTVNNNWTLTCGTSVASIKVTAAYVKNT
jgi:hypothetical protein